MRSFNCETSFSSLALSHPIFSFVACSTLVTLWFTGATCWLTYFFVAQPEVASVRAIGTPTPQTRLLPKLIMCPLCRLHGCHRSDAHSRPMPPSKESDLPTISGSVAPYYQRRRNAPYVVGLGATE